MQACSHVTKALFLCEINTCRLNAARKAVSSRSVACACLSGRRMVYRHQQQVGPPPVRADLKTNYRAPLIIREYIGTPDAVGQRRHIARKSDSEAMK